MSLLKQMIAAEDRRGWTEIERLAHQGVNMQLPVVERYEHHGAAVFVRTDLKGKHRDHCLCFSCEKFNPMAGDNCHIARALFLNCVKFNVVTPVWECPEYQPKVQAATSPVETQGEIG